MPTVQKRCLDVFNIVKPTGSKESIHADTKILTPGLSVTSINSGKVQSSDGRAYVHIGTCICKHPQGDAAVAQIGSEAKLCPIK